MKSEAKTVTKAAACGGKGILGCKFYLPVDEKSGLCRRNPPQMTLANVKVRNSGGETEFTSNWQFPPMMSFGWCGEHKPSKAEG